MKTNLRSLDAARPIIPDDVRASVGKVLDGEWSFVLIAKRPDGEWERSLFLRANQTYEALGALEALKRHLLNDDDED